MLCKKFKGHEASVSAALVLKDEPGCKEIITSSLDKTLATWTLEGCDLEGPNLVSQKVEVGGGPVFSLSKVTERKDSKKDAPMVYCGLAAKEIGAWEIGKAALDDKVRMNGHTGWVRSLASSGKYLFSCGCNYLRQWDITYPIPKEVGEAKLFTGDILAIATGGDKVFTAGADGSLRTWTLGKGGELVEAAVREKAHDGRATGLAVVGNLVYSVSYDGSIKAWDAHGNLNLVMKATAAHEGERLYCITLGPDGLLYTGGDDHMVRRWDPRVLQPVGGPLAVHTGSVKALAAGSKECVVSGDATGEVAVWNV